MLFLPVVRTYLNIISKAYNKNLKLTQNPEQDQPEGVVKLIMLNGTTPN